MYFYKEYLQLFTMQMLVQDGRSLDHVHSAEERGKILIRRSLGNLFTALYLVYKKLNISGMNTNLREKFFKIVGKVVATYNFFLKPNNGISERSIHDYRFIIQNIHLSLACFLSNISNSSIATWMVPNFDVFGVIDDADEEFVLLEAQPTENLRTIEINDITAESSVETTNYEENKNSSSTLATSSPKNNSCSSSSVNSSNNNNNSEFGDESYTEESKETIVSKKSDVENEILEKSDDNDDN